MTPHEFEKLSRSVACAQVTMNNSKFSKVRASSCTRGMRSPRSKGCGKLHYNVGLLILAGVTSALVIMFGRKNSEDSVGLIDDFKRMISSPTEELLQSWNYSSYSFKPNVSDWNKQRLTWLTEHQNLRPRVGGKPRVLMASGSTPYPCNPTILSHLLLRASKNKLDYSRMHDIEYFYNLGEPDQDFSDWWVKLPLIRILMLQHPEAEWIWWLDADAVITDLSFEPPYAEFEHENLVLYGEERHVYDKRTSNGLSTANFLIRNCQWSLDLLDEWASMGTATVREESGNFQSGVLTDRPLGYSGDDQSGLVALLAQDKRNRIGKQRWAPMVKLVKETEYAMSANWSVVGPKLEELSQENHEVVPFVTHFKGCLPSCNVKPELSKTFLDACVEQLGRAFDFADNQVYKRFGFEHRKLGDQLKPYEKKPIDHKKEFTADGEEVFRILPRFPDWDERRRKHIQEHPPTSKDEVVLVSGSAPKPCLGKLGSHMLLRGLKNLIDYSRKNDVILFYNNAAIDKNLTGWWSKLPLLKMMMINNPQTEWIWWLDSDAVLTDMDYRFDFARYNASGYNVVMYGVEDEVYEQRKYNGINTGNFLIRNCQWSFDLLDKWASFGATHELRVTNEPLLNNFLSNRPPGWDADDQCCLVYLLITEREKWGVKARLETEIVMSGYWEYCVPLFRTELAEKRPFVTHFAGCKPCQDPVNEVNVRCLVGIDETYNFADNQVLEKYGLRHVDLNSTELLQRSRSVSKSPIVIEIIEIEESIEEQPEENIFDASIEDKVDTSEEKKVVEETVDMSDEEKVKKPKQEKVDASVEKSADIKERSGTFKSATYKPKQEVNPSMEKSADSKKKSGTFKSATYKPEQEEFDASVEKSADSGQKTTGFKSATYNKTSHEKEEDETDLPHADIAATKQEEDIEVPEKKLVTNDDRFGRVQKE